MGKAREGPSIKQRTLDEIDAMMVSGDGKDDQELIIFPSKSKGIESAEEVGKIPVKNKVTGNNYLIMSLCDEKKPEMKKRSFWELRANRYKRRGL